MVTTWEAVCAKTIQAFNGETPGADLEAEIMARWQHDAKRVQGAIDRTAALHHAGKITSGWAVLRAELAKHGPERQRKAQRMNTEQFAAWELDNLERAEREAEQRAEEFKAHYRCADCGRVKLPWWTECLQHACVNRRRAATSVPTPTISNNTEVPF